VKRLFSALSILLVAAMIFTGCSNNETDAQSYENNQEITDDAYVSSDLDHEPEVSYEYDQIPYDPTAVYAFDNDSSTFWDANGPGGVLYMTFDAPQLVNNVTLREHAAEYGQPGHSRLFTIEARVDGNWELVHGSDVIGAFRMCVFDEVMTDALRLTILEIAFGRRVRIYDMTAGFQEPVRHEPFRVFAYIHPNVFIYHDFNDYAHRLAGVTHLVYIGNTHLGVDENEQIQLVSSAGSPDNISLMRDAVSDLDLDLLVSITCGPRVDALNLLTDDPDDIARIASQAFDFVMYHGFDGVEINFEGVWFDDRQRRAGYSMLIEALGPKLHEVGKSISVSVITPYTFTAEAFEILNYIHIMIYDHTDTEQVWHSTYNAVLRDIENTATRGLRLIDANGDFTGEYYQVPRDKINGGVPFYGMGNVGAVREWDRTFSYSHLYRNRIGVFNPHSNYCFAANAYYNGPTTIRDKVAYMIVNAEIGGVMIWAINHDLPFDHEYSLLKAINNTIDIFSY